MNIQPTLFEIPASNIKMQQSVRTALDPLLCKKNSTSFQRDQVNIFWQDALKLYSDWPSPVTIISDGPYGISGFPGDLATHKALGEWYEPHIIEWTKKSSPLTSLWFWNTEIGWASVHPVLEKHGWVYRGAAVWDKGIAHIAGNSNTKSLRRLPTVTELAVHYVKKAQFYVDNREMSMKEWLRYEWKRTGLPLSKTNEACGVKNAATRKYFTKCHLWYFPPVEAFAKFSTYANMYGNPTGRPYFSLDGCSPLTDVQWGKMRAKFSLEAGITNVWSAPAVRDAERIKLGGKAAHMNQKPLSLMELNIRLTSDEDDVIWEPFGGMCTGAIAAHKLGRRCYSTEINEDFYKIAISRLAHYK